MKTALIGYTGFVGGNLHSQFKFDDLYNSQNIETIKGKEYDLVVSAANRADMWRINSCPEEDLAEIEKFISIIGEVKINHLVLISTVGVYTQPLGVDEDTPIDPEELQPYGRHRYLLENYCMEHFQTTIIRLPGLFGPGLKKNVIYDLLNNNMVDKIHADGVYQYYNLNNIWGDIQLVIKNKLKLVNFATPPVATSTVAREVFGLEFTNKPDGIKPAHWDVRTKHWKLFGDVENYICSQENEIEGMKLYIDGEVRDEAVGI